MNYDANAQDSKPIDLDSIQIASPCTADWDAMEGDAKSRFCGECSLHVHDVSAMTSDEAMSFLREQSGRTCVRMRRRADGRVLTQDCPVGWAKVRAKMRAARRRATVFAATLFGAVACGFRATSPDDSTPAFTTDPKVEPAPELHPLMGEAVIMGDVACPPEELMGRIATPDIDSRGVETPGGESSVK